MTTVAKRTKRAAKTAPAVPRPAAKTVSERVAELRARRAAIGLAEVRGVFAHTEDHPEIKQKVAPIIRKLVRQRGSGQ